MEPEYSLPLSQEPTNCLHPEPDQSTAYHPITPLQDPYWYYSPTYVLVFLLVSLLQAFTLIKYMRSSPPHSCYKPCTPHTPRLDHSNYRLLGEEYKSWNSSLRNFLHSPITSSLFGPNIAISTLFSNTFSLCSFLSVRYRASQPCRTTDKIIFIHILIFNFVWFVKVTMKFSYA
jgi:hypothetical protein